MSSYTVRGTNISPFFNRLQNASGNRFDVGYRRDIGGVLCARSPRAVEIGHNIFLKGRIASCACGSGSTFRSFYPALGSEAFVWVPVRWIAYIWLPQVILTTL